MPRKTKIRKVKKFVAKIPWHVGIEKMIPSMVRISTPNGYGSGVFILRSNDNSFCAVATAAHVIAHAYYWEEPIRLLHINSNKTRLLRPSERAIFIDDDTDEAIIIFSVRDFPFPQEPLKLIEKDYAIKPGVEIGWLGFPNIARDNVCFFSGKISTYIKKVSMYLVDGVAIHGVSGGPAFRLTDKGVELIGVVTQYLANRSTGETLPGLSAIIDVDQFHRYAGTFHTLTDAKKAEEKNPPMPTRKVEKKRRKFTDRAGIKIGNK